jgi:hypothetical protein
MNNTENISREVNKDSDVDNALIKRIVEIQDLPEDVVIRFLKAAGSLSSINFGKCSFDEHN